MSGQTAAGPTAVKPGSATFSGTYESADVTFLLTVLSSAQAGQLFEQPERKEQLIQSGQRHYSEMISPERVPEPAYQRIFENALARHAARMGREVAQLVRDLDAQVAGPITLCSLVRAGVPLGVLLVRGLRALGRDAAHFGVSIIRDRGIDEVAMREVCRLRPASGVVFVDGWTGKGAIADELERSFADRPGGELAPPLGSGQPPRLVVLADPAGRAWLSAGYEDWLIPSGILGGTVSGLVSRSILNASLTGPGDYHATLWLDELAAHDVSRPFVDRIGSAMLDQLPATRASAAPPSSSEREHVRTLATAVVARVACDFGIGNRNRIKPGIAEATRAVLRRAPARILVAGVDDPDLAGLNHLARRAGVPVECQGDRLYPYRAITIIADATDASVRPE